MRRPGRLWSTLLLGCFLLYNPYHHFVLADPVQLHTTIQLSKDLINAMASTTSIALLTGTITPTKTSSISRPVPSPTIAKRCLLCPSNNTKGLTCFKNTQCVPVSLLCNSSTNPCMDTTGLPSPNNPIYCQDQLCFARDYLPLPSPGLGKINRNSRTNCRDGSYFSLYGSDTLGMRYTESCIGDGQVQQPTTCKPWEYLSQSSCYLRTCGPGMNCTLPLVCKKTALTEVYGLCMSSNASADPGPDDTDGGDYGSDGSPKSSKERLLQGLLVGFLGLFAGVVIGIGLWHWRKKHLRQILDGEHTNRGKTSLLSALCGCRRKRRIGSGPVVTENAGDSRVVSLVESDSHDTYAGNDYRSNIISAMRWRWGNQARRVPFSAAVTQGGQAIIPEMEPPPLYQQNNELPTYRDRNTIMLTPVNACNEEETSVERPLDDTQVNVRIEAEEHEAPELDAPRPK